MWPARLFLVQLEHCDEHLEIVVDKNRELEHLVNPMIKLDMLDDFRVASTSTKSCLRSKFNDFHPPVCILALMKTTVDLCNKYILYRLE